MRCVDIIQRVKVSWKSLSSIFADVVISPWNLLVGGLLIKHFSTVNAFISIVLGYLIIGLIFYFYGGLGFEKKRESSQMLNSIIGSKWVKFAIPILLAIGQIGWAGVNIELGGKSLSQILSFSPLIGVAIYAIALIVVASLNLHKQGIVKTFVVISSFSLILYTLWAKLNNIELASFLNFSPSDTKSIFWGVSIVVASLISFCTVTPDFFKDVKEKSDILHSTIFGLIIPGIITCFMGAFLFFDISNYDLVALISTLTFPLFPHILNVSTNTDGAVAIYTPGLKIENLFKVSLNKAIMIAGSISFVLALLQISNNLEIWLKFLSLAFPSLIGVAFAHSLLKKNKSQQFQKDILNSLIISLILSIIISMFFPPVLIALFMPVTIMIFNGYKLKKQISPKL